MGKKSKNYTLEFKLEAIEMYLSGEHGGMNLVSKKLNLPSTSMLPNWIKKYQKFGKDGLVDTRGKSKQNDTPNIGKSKSKHSSLEEEVLYLRAQNDLLKKLLELKRG
jgi:transposase